MKFLVDAQLPRRLAQRLQAVGHDALHTLDLPDQNRTTDQSILAIAAAEERVVVTKDADFVHSHILLGEPAQLLLIATGNITNAELETLLLPQLPAIVSALETHAFVEMNRHSLIIHGS
jgi:predicted nuclease of predicted toxin-antitoxin system